MIILIVVQHPPVIMCTSAFHLAVNQIGLLLWPSTGSCPACTLKLSTPMPSLWFSVELNSSHCACAFTLMLLHWRGSAPHSKHAERHMKANTHNPNSTIYDVSRTSSGRYIHVTYTRVWAHRVLFTHPWCYDSGLLFQAAGRGDCSYAAVYLPGDLCGLAKLLSNCSPRF